MAGIAPLRTPTSSSTPAAMEPPPSSSLPPPAALSQVFVKTRGRKLAPLWVDLAHDKLKSLLEAAAGLDPGMRELLEKPFSVLVYSRHPPVTAPGPACFAFAGVSTLRNSRHTLANLTISPLATVEVVCMYSGGGRGSSPGMPRRELASWLRRYRRYSLSPPKTPRGGDEGDDDQRKAAAAAAAAVAPLTARIRWPQPLTSGGLGALTSVRCSLSSTSRSIVAITSSVRRQLLTPEQGQPLATAPAPALAPTPAPAPVAEPTPAPAPAVSWADRNRRLRLLRPRPRGPVATALAHAASSCGRPPRGPAAPLAGKCNLTGTGAAAPTTAAAAAASQPAASAAITAIAAAAPSTPRLGRSSSLPETPRATAALGRSCSLPHVRGSAEPPVPGSAAAGDDQAPPPSDPAANNLDLDAAAGGCNPRASQPSSSPPCHPSRPQRWRL